MPKLFIIIGLLLGFGGIHLQSQGYNWSCNSPQLITSIDDTIDLALVGYLSWNVPNPHTYCSNHDSDCGYWLEFLTLSSGNLSFNIIPDVPTVDFNWALFDASNTFCNDIFYSDTLALVCNYSPSVTNNGITGANGGIELQENPVIPVIAGQLYKLFLSKIGYSSYGCVLNFNGSTCLFDQSVGINENKIGEQIKTGPNPTNGLVNLTINPAFVNEISGLKLIELTGKTLFSQSSYFSSNMSFDFSNHPAGLYFLQISTSTEQHSIKIILE